MSEFEEAFKSWCATSNGEQTSISVEVSSKYEGSLLNKDGRCELEDTRKFDKCKDLYVRWAGIQFTTSK